MIQILSFPSPTSSFHHSISYTLKSIKMVLKKTNFGLQGSYKERIRFSNSNNKSMVSKEVLFVNFLWFLTEKSLHTFFKTSYQTDSTNTLFWAVKALFYEDISCIHIWRQKLLFAHRLNCCLHKWKVVCIHIEKGVIRRML